MPVTVTPESPRHPEATALLHASHAYSASLYKPEENFVLSVDDLCAPDIRFLAARVEGRIVGTAALALRDGYGEIKSMFVAPEARGLGVAGALMRRLIAEGVAQRLPMLRLETGPLNHDAMRMYARHGFARCGVFGDYPDSPASVFMERATPALRRLTPDDDMAPVHALLTGAFAYMDGVIDPPSSMTRMTPADLGAEAGRAELWVLDGPLACMILTDKGDTLYLGKLAIAGDWRGTGLARVMIEHAVTRAKALGRPSVTLQTRVELTGNQRAFQGLGFQESGRTAHPGYGRPTSITYTRAV
jgi:ribosomal protein S18 acetylase RimI-like enzyme